MKIGNSPNNINPSVTSSLWSERMFLHVTDARHVENFRVRVRFNDGTDAEINLADSLTGPIFEPLRDPAKFKKFTLEGHTLAWPNGADFAPEYLHSLAASESRV